MPKLAFLTCFRYNFMACFHVDIGMWPSGKAPGFGPGIRGFESLHPSQQKKSIMYDGLFCCLWRGGIRTGSSGSFPAPCPKKCQWHFERSLAKSIFLLALRRIPPSQPRVKCWVGFRFPFDIFCKFCRRIIPIPHVQSSLGFRL